MFFVIKCCITGRVWNVFERWYFWSELKIDFIPWLNNLEGINFRASVKFCKPRFHTFVKYYKKYFNIRNECFTNLSKLVFEFEFFYKYSKHKFHTSIKCCAVLELKFQTLVKFCNRIFHIFLKYTVKMRWNKTSSKYFKKTNYNMYKLCSTQIMRT